MARLNRRDWSVLLVCLAYSGISAPAEAPPTPANSTGGSQDGSAAAVKVTVSDAVAKDLKSWEIPVAVFTSKKSPLKSFAEIKEAPFGTFGAYNRASGSSVPEKEVLDLVSRMERLLKTAGGKYPGTALVSDVAIPSLFTKVPQLRLFFVAGGADVINRVLKESDALRVEFVDETGKPIWPQKDAK